VRPRQHVPLACPLAVTLLLAAPATALADSPHVMLTPAILGPIGHAIGGVFHAIAGVVLGGLKWTVDLAGKFILATLGGLIRLLIPRSWAQQGLEVMHWIVAVPNYAGTVTSPSGQSVYGFAGINALRDLFMWIGAALLPLTLVNATSRAAIGTGRHVLAPIGRVLGMAAVLVSYPWWWSQAAAAVNQLTHFVLALPPVTHGIYKLMQYAVGGIALGGWQLIDLFLMGAIGVALLGLIFLKVVIILLGALLYALGPLMIGLVPTEGGVAIARAWASAAAVLMMLPLAWSTILAVGALLVNDSSTAGPLIAGSGTIAHLLGGLLLALAGLASLWLCIRAAREAGAVLRGQLAGVLTVGGGSRGVATASAAPPHARRAAESLRAFPGRVAATTGAAVSAAGPAGQALAASASGLAAHSRRGLIGASGTLVRTGVAAAAPGTAALVGRSRAGAAAVRMARAGTASWQQSAGTNGSPSQPARRTIIPTGTAAPASTVSSDNGASSTRNADPSDRANTRVPPTPPPPGPRTVPPTPANTATPGTAPQPSPGSASTGRQADRAVNRTNARSAPPRPNTPTDGRQQPRHTRPVPKPRGAGKPRGRSRKGGS
jgi:hypothetical protein